jgi:hypothetical protein
MKCLDGAKGSSHKTRRSFIATKHAARIFQRQPNLSFSKTAEAMYYLRPHASH